MKKLVAISGESSKATIDKSDVQTRVEQISSHADEVMIGLVAVSSAKKPIGSGGEVQVTLGWSSKTRDAVESIRSGKPFLGTTSKKGKTSNNSIGTLIDDNVPEKKQSQTDF
jgi:hypothetical protein